MNAAVFLDKDGTLVEDVPYNVDPDLIRLVPGAPDALRQLIEVGYQLVVVSNQSGVARGFFDESALATVRARLEALLAPEGVSLAGFYYCPHAPEDRSTAAAQGCLCRKPADGLIRRAAQELDLELRRSWMVGDILDDVEAGNRAGCRTILVDCGSETEWRLSGERVPQGIARDLYTAARMISRAARRRSAA